MRILDSQLRLDRFFRNLVRSQHRLLILDYDGTLAPFCLERDRARPYPGVRDRLRRILAAETTRVLLLSGRPAAEVARLLVSELPTLDPVPEIWGCHGYERKLPRGPVVSAPLPGGVRRALEEAAAAAVRLGWTSRLERKSAGVAAHSRGLDPGPAAERLEELWAAWQEIAAGAGLRVQSFDGGIELQAPPADKGAAVAELLATQPADCAIAYLGDDATDEDAFAALGSAGLAVLVRAELRPTRAHLWLRPPKELLDFLDAWHRLTAPGPLTEPALAPAGGEPSP